LGKQGDHDGIVARVQGRRRAFLDSGWDDVAASRLSRGMGGRPGAGGALLVPEDGKAHFTKGTVPPGGEKPGTGPAYPVKPDTARISAGYPKYPGGASHRGVDFATHEGNAVYSVVAGTVKSIDNSHSNNWNTYNVPNDHSYGNFVKIQLLDGKTTMIYAHMHNDIQVSVGESVYANTLIGYSGNTGHSSGPHLHFEVNMNGQPVDPTLYLPDLSIFPGVYQ
jgi:murein DD-endopeptidase MepM/ murein hydrolase activator NlpD